MRTVFVVQSGEYSDRRVDAIFSTEQRAKRFIERFAEPHQFDISEWSLDMYADMPPGYRAFFLRMTKDGQAHDIEHKTSTYAFNGGPPMPGFDCKGNMILSVIARDTKHAIKIANEIRAQLIANDQWGNQP